jgi:hypothetical protein
MKRQLGALHHLALIGLLVITLSRVRTAHRSHLNNHQISISIKVMNITTLPNDIFLLIVAYLSPEDLILNRRVSKQFHSAFTESELCRHMLLQHYPRAREARDTTRHSPVHWADTFAKVAGRYSHLKAGVPARIEKLPLGKSFVVPTWAKCYPVAPWNRHLQFEEKTAPFHYPDTLWAYEDGLLVFPSAEFQRYVLYDLGTGTFSDADFDPDRKIVRRIRLKERVFVIEWCESEPYHQLNENEMVFRHFATAYDVLGDGSTGQWNLRFRSVTTHLLSSSS